MTLSVVMKREMNGIICDLFFLTKNFLTFSSSFGSLKYHILITALVSPVYYYIHLHLCIGVALSS